ncbi:uncharacterized protein ARMOST_11984 [Armillaria ostoyae]|uniref:Uncharacterized protein n=1 Tax=Armillaria ostoyae TaxID=47428 RepID=A0A284RIT6_ARMOS|nr:uncharacterized protein ARMOST_11984 [Armillaria ostoyae]
MLIYDDGAHQNDSGHTAPLRDISRTSKEMPHTIPAFGSFPGLGRQDTYRRWLPGVINALSGIYARYRYANIARAVQAALGKLSHEAPTWYTLLTAFYLR